MNSIKNRSTSEIKRLIKNGAVEVNGEKVTNYKYKPKVGDLIKIGKGEFIKINDKK